MLNQSFLDSIEMAKDHFTCVICLDNPQDPVLLKCCGRICCKRCIEKWFNENKNCPFCRSIISQLAESTISIPWAESLATVLGLYSAPNDEQTICKIHSKRVEYQCESCKTLLCSDCIYDMLTGANADHKDHKITKLSDKLLHAKKEIQKLLPQLSQKLEHFRDEANKIQKYSNGISTFRDDFNVKLYSEFNEAINSLKERYQEKEKYVNSIIEAKVTLKQLHEAMEKGKTLSTMETTASDSDDESAELEIIQKHTQTIKALTKKVNDTFVPGEDLKVENPMVPDFHTIDIFVKNFKKHVEEFSKMPETEPRYLYSNTHTICGNQWRAKIFPNGNSNGINTHLSLFVELLKGPPTPEKFQYTIEIIPAKSTSFIIHKTYTSEFVQNDSWGWNKVAALSSILSDDYIQQDGSLHLKLSIKANSRYQEVIDIERKITQIREKTEELKKLIGSSSDDEDKDTD